MQEDGPDDHRDCGVATEDQEVLGTGEGEVRDALGSAAGLDSQQVSSSSNASTLASSGDITRTSSGNTLSHNVG